MTENTTLETPTLEGEAALDLWRRGREAWNNWIDQHLAWDISFKGVDFSKERDTHGNLSFAGYRFGSRKVDFSIAKFGDGNVSFYGATFDDGSASFSGATFGNGNLDFSGVNFGNGNLDFFSTNFGNGNVHFYEVICGNGNIDFSRARFGNSNINFSESRFGDGDVNFSKAVFKKGNVSFARTIFGNGNITFSEASFGTGDVYFFEATFGDGSVLFTRTTFGDGGVYFSGATFGESAIDFRQARIRDLYFNPKSFASNSIQAEGLSIKGQAIFDLPSSAITLKSFNLYSAYFDGPLSLMGELSIIPDLRTTRYSHQVDLSALNVKLPRVWQRLGWQPKLSRVAKTPKDGARLRRLKEIAETNKDHQAALRFSADENRAKRWIETSWAGSVLDMAFSAFSDYGQNILRPFVALIVLTAASMGLYKTLATASFANWWTGWAQGAVLSASNSLPFLPQSRDLRTDALTALYGTTTTPDLWVNALMITQGVLSFVFLFLIGLGLRNRFRL